MFPQQGLYGERCPISRANGLFIHLYLSESSFKKPYHEMEEKHMVTVHRAPHTQKVYIQWGAVWFPKGIVYDTASTTPVPCRLQLDTFHLGLGSPVPRQPVCIAVTLNRVSPAHLLPPPTGPRVRIHVTLRYGQRVDLWEASEQILAYIFLATETFVFYVRFLHNSIQCTTNNFPNIT